MASSGRHEPRFSTSLHLKLSTCLSRLLSLQCCVMSWKLGGSKWRSGLWVSWRGCGSWVSYGRARRDRGPGLQAVDSWALAGLGRLAPGSWLGSALLRGWSTRSPASEAHAKLPVTSRPCTSLKCPWLKQATWPSIASVMGGGHHSTVVSVRYLLAPYNSSPCYLSDSRCSIPARLVAGSKSIVFTELIVFLGMRLYDAITPTLRLLAKEKSFIEIKLT